MPSQERAAHAVVLMLLLGFDRRRLQVQGDTVQYGCSVEGAVLGSFDVRSSGS
jgi:hypothetical protein